AQYRAYEPGDEPRQVDWKLYARSDRYFVREAERDHPGRSGSACALAACTVEIALRQGDRFGLASIGGDGVRVHAAGTGSRQRDRCLLALHALTASGRWPAD